MSEPTQTSENRDTKVIKAPSAAGAKAHPTITMIVRAEEERNRKSSMLMPLVGIGAVIVSLIVLGLFLPPINFYSRYINTEGQFASLGDTVSEDGLTLSVDNPNGNLEVRMMSVSAENFLKGEVTNDNWQCGSSQALPSYLTPVGMVYSVESQGQTESPINLSITLPNDYSGNALDLYGFDPALARWRFLPSSHESNNEIKAATYRIPNCLIMMEPVALPGVLGIALSSQSELTPELNMSSDRVFVTGLQPGRDGRLLGVFPVGINDGQRNLIPVIANYRHPSVVDRITVDTIISNPEFRERHVTELVNFATQGNFVGIAIDYRDLPTDQETADRYTRFLLDLGRGLRAQGQILVVIVPFPENSGTQWQSGAYDFARIGQIADEIVLRTPYEPASFGKNGVVDKAIEWATSQINRYQLFLALETASVEIAETGEVAPIGAGEVVALLGWATIPSSDVYVAPGDIISAELANSSFEIGFDETSQTTILTTTTENDQHTIWLADSGNLTPRIRLATEHKLGGVVLFNLADSSTEAVFDTITAYRAEQPEMDNNSPIVVQLGWTVRDANGVILGVTNDANLLYSIPEGVTGVEIVAQANIGNQSYELTSYSVAVASITPDSEAEVALVEPSPTLAIPTATQEPTEVSPTVEATLEPTETEEPTQEVTEVAQAATATAVLFPTNTQDPSAPVLFPTNTPAGSAPTTDSSVPESFPTNTPLPMPTTVRQPTATFAPLNLPPATGPVSLELVGQVESPSETTLATLQSAGSNWVMIYVPYFSGATPFDQRDQIEQLHEQGFKVMYTVVGQPYEMDGQNFVRNYANFLSAIANFGADAIQVWNAPDSELYWPADRIDPARYTELLKESAEAIRAGNPDTIIISAALQPGDEDQLYYQGMAAAGVASLVDCIGVRYDQGTVAPDAITGDGRGENAEYYFSPTMSLASEAFGGSRPLCLTIGYLSAEGYTPLPDEFEWATNTTNAQQAQWLAQAAQLAKQNGNVQLMIVWNIDFSFLGFDAAAGYAIVRRDGSCPSCSLLSGIIQQ